MMHALVLEGPNAFSIQDVERPTPGHVEVLCRVKTVTICGTDAHLFGGDYWNVGGGPPTRLGLLPDDTTRSLVVVIMETGLRATDACGLAFNAIIEAASAGPAYVPSPRCASSSWCLSISGPPKPSELSQQSGETNQTDRVWVPDDSASYRIRALLYAGKPNWNPLGTLTPATR